MTVPNKMTAIEISRPGGPEQLRAVEMDTPRPGPDEVLIEVEAAGINRPDVFQRRGHYPPPPGAPETPGLEVAGTIAAIGNGVKQWQPGDRVCALVAGGGYAEYCVAPQEQVLPVPKGFSMTEAAALPETFFTVWTNLFDRAGLVQKESVLIHGGSSGIGTTAIMLAKAFGAIVYATAGTAEKCAKCEELGAQRAINYDEEDFVGVIDEITGGEGVDIILDMVGGDYVQRNINAAAVDGRLISISFLKGSKVSLDLRPLITKRLTLSGSTLRPRSPSEKGKIAQALYAHVWPLLENGSVRPIIDSSFKLKEAAKAHARMESSEHIGKIMLVVPE